VPKRKVSVPEPVKLLAEARGGLARVCEVASLVTSSEKEPACTGVPERLALATVLLATCGWGERSPWRTRVPIDWASVVSMLLRLVAAEICASRVSDFACRRSVRPANCAAARLVASDAMSIPLPAPSAEMIDWVAEDVELVVTMSERTAGKGRD